VHEHEAPEAAERRKPRAEANGGAGGPGILSLQQQAGNRAVAGAVARAVEIEEMTSKFDVRDEAKLGKDTKGEVTEALKGERERAGGGAATDDAPAPTEQEQPTGGGAETLPPGGHATMEEEPS
jgi:hypothetical protein